MHIHPFELSIPSIVQRSSTSADSTARLLLLSFVRPFLKIEQGHMLLGGYSGTLCQRLMAVLVSSEPSVLVQALVLVVHS